MPKREDWDRLVNKVWPKDMPKPTDQEAITGVRRLYRKAMGKPWKGEVRITTGNRYTWVYWDRDKHVRYIRVNPSHGWREIVHLLAHWLHRQKFPHHRPHHYTELELEAELTRYAIKHGFHEGRLKSKPRDPKPKENPITEKRRKLEAQVARWETKQKRAKTALKKLKPRLAYYRREERNIPFTLD